MIKFLMKAKKLCRKPIADKKVMLRFFIEKSCVEANGGEQACIDECIFFLKKSGQISPNHEPMIDDDYELNAAIDYVKRKIKDREWHDQIFPVEGYNAIILSPYGDYIKVMDKVVDKFKEEEGWDCKWSSAYDSRGPHYCFYLSSDQIKTMP